MDLFGNSIKLIENGFSYPLSKNQIYTQLLNKNELVFIIIKNNYEFVDAYLSLLQNQNTIVLLSVNDIANLKKLIKKFKPSAILIPDNFCDKNFTQKFVVNREYSLVKFDEFEKMNISLSPLILLSTSGSTGSKKFVKISYDNLLSNAQSIKTFLDIKETDVTITNLPLHYSFGLSVLNSHMLAGATIVLTNHSVIQKEFWDEMKEHKVTSLYGVPYTFEMLDRMRFFKMQLPDLKLLAQAGGKMPSELQRKFIEYSEANNIKYYTMYGQTEATARMSYVPYEKATEKIGSIGIAIPNGRFELKDKQNQTIGNSGEVGELVYFGPNVSLGYATCYKDLSKEDENKGVLYTGDLAKRDEDGFYYIVGRKNRFLKLFGNRVSLQEIEEQLESKGIEAVCGGQDDKLITYTTNAFEIDNIRKWLSEFTKIHFSAFEVKWIDEIPRNESGKILYTKLFS